MLHEKLVFGRRVRVLSERLADLLPKGKVLDVGCGDGTIDKIMMSRRPDVAIEGIDVLVRPSTHIPVTAFDGTHIPFPDQSFDSVMFVDVLHHTDDPLILLREAKRVGRSIVIKDHYRDGFLANETLRFMDWVGNAHHGVVLPYNYWPRAKWDAAFQSLALKPVGMQTTLGLYPFPASLVFERGLHFVTRLETA